MLYKYSLWPIISKEVKRFHVKPTSRIKALNILVAKKLPWSIQFLEKVYDLSWKIFIIFGVYNYKPQSYVFIHLRSNSNFDA